MTQVVDARRISEELRAEIRDRVAKLEGRRPHLAAVLVGADPASQVYVRNKRRACEQTGIESTLVELPESTSERELLRHVERLNADPHVSGILVQLPLPPAIDPSIVAAAVDPAKDVDGLHPWNVGRLVAGRPGLVPCTPLGCIEILDRSGVTIEGARCVVIGRSEIVGKPVALLLLHRHGTVTICHSRTRELADVVRQGDIVVAAAGRARMVRGDWIKPGAAVIDVGVNRIDDRLVGDVDFDGAMGRAGWITKVPGGVGLLTVTMLLRNTLHAHESQHRA
jgi:methylenetetrahydrofolate dehydrogenase (NADP+)/methenyltetrahydrofolate cyclohydrolase